MHPDWRPLSVGPPRAAWPGAALLSHVLAYLEAAGLKQVTVSELLGD